MHTQYKMETKREMLARAHPRFTTVTRRLLTHARARGPLKRQQKCEGEKKESARETEREKEKEREEKTRSDHLNTQRHTKIKTTIPGVRS